METKNGKKVVFWSRYIGDTPDEENMSAEMRMFLQGFVDAAEMDGMFTEVQEVVVDFSYGRPYLYPPGQVPPEPQPRPNIDTLKTSAGTPIRVYLEYLGFQPEIESVGTELLEDLIAEADDFEAQNPGLPEIIMAILGITAEVSFRRPDDVLPEQKEGVPTLELKTANGTPIRVHCVSKELQEHLFTMPPAAQEMIVGNATEFELENPGVEIVAIVELDMRLHMLLPGEELPEQTDEQSHASEGFSFDIPGAVVIDSEDLRGLIEALTGRSVGDNGYHTNEMEDEKPVELDEDGFPKLVTSKGTPIQWWLEYKGFKPKLATMPGYIISGIIRAADVFEADFPGQSIIVMFTDKSIQIALPDEELPEPLEGLPEKCLTCASTTCPVAPAFATDAD